VSSSSITSSAIPSGGNSSSLKSRSFIALTTTQFLTATNDNIFRWLAVGIGKDYFPDNHSFVLVLGIVCFSIPYILLSAIAGYFSDRFSKRDVIVWCKYAEIGIMLMGILAIMMGVVQLLFVAVFFMGAQSALFSPAKLGAIPELLDEDKIPAANGLFGLTTIGATVLGMAVGSWLSEATGDYGMGKPWLSGGILLVMSSIGVVASLMIRRLPIAAPERTFPFDAPQQTWRDLRTLASNKALLRVALGITFFWAVGSLANLNIDQFVTEGGGDKETDKLPMLFCLIFGIGLGSVMAGIWSAGRVELGMLTPGAAGIALFSFLLFTVEGQLIDPTNSLSPSFVFACLFLFALGFSAGLFNVPLAAYIQARSPTRTRGSILAANNFLVFVGILLFSCFYGLLRIKVGPQHEPWLTARQVFLVSSLMTIPVLLYVLYRIPQASLRFLAWMLSRSIYRVRSSGMENIPAQEGAVLAPNHVSWVDGVLLVLTSPRPVRMVVFARDSQSRVANLIGRIFGVIMIHPGSNAVEQGMEEAAEAAGNGELVCIFPEAELSRSGQLQTFTQGAITIHEKARVPVIPVYLDGLWGSIFSFKHGKFSWRWPRQIPYPVWIHYGQPIDKVENVFQLRQAVQDLGAVAVDQRMKNDANLTRDFILGCKKRGGRLKYADSSGEERSGKQLLMRTLILRRLLRPLLDDDEEFVGVMIPPTVAGATTNTALAIDKRIAVNLNYSVSSEVLNACIDLTGIKHVITSRLAYMEFKKRLKLDLNELNAELIFLEDFRKTITLWDKIAGALASKLPAWLLIRKLGLNSIKGDDTQTIIFTSGSTGIPKGVMLTHANISSNIDAIDQVVKLTPEDTIVGFLPFFHSFGFTVTLWAALKLNIASVFHTSPLDCKAVGELCQKYKGTVFLATPTFLRGFLRRCEPELLETIDVVVTGAEKLPLDLAEAFEKRFGTRPVEGYGATELSPLVSVNIPPSRATDENQGIREGSVGRPVPGVVVKVTDLETDELLGVDQPGMLWVKGPNVMKGYYASEEITSEVLIDDWYRTGDVAKIDSDGFIHITGRISRFSKIGGEMVPHIQIEDAINAVLGASEEDGLLVAVTAIPHEKKGERLIVLHLPFEKQIDQVTAELRDDHGLPNLFIPSSDSYLLVDDLPILGTGKLDLKALQQLALDHYGDDSSS
jgi:acyl-[acyl-carrier-protein]-phospholipid O-acyltransferase/long-chain-fatty-acid--[acyl-carrier-protein] ligase